MHPANLLAVRGRTLANAQGIRIWVWRCPKCGYEGWTYAPEQLKCRGCTAWLLVLDEDDERTPVVPPVWDEDDDEPGPH